MRRGRAGAGVGQGERVHRPRRRLGRSAVDTCRRQGATEHCRPSADVASRGTLRRRTMERTCKASPAPLLPPPVEGRRAAAARDMAAAWKSALRHFFQAGGAGGIVGRMVRVMRGMAENVPPWKSMTRGRSAAAPFCGAPSAATRGTCTTAVWETRHGRGRECMAREGEGESEERGGERERGSEERERVSVVLSLRSKRRSVCRRGRRMNQAARCSFARKREKVEVDGGGRKEEAGGSRLSSLPHLCASARRAPGARRTRRAPACSQARPRGRCSAPVPCWRKRWQHEGNCQRAHVPLPAFSFSRLILSSFSRFFSRAFLAPFLISAAHLRLLKTRGLAIQQGVGDAAVFVAIGGCCCCVLFYHIIAASLECARLAPGCCAGQTAAAARLCGGSKRHSGGGGEKRRKGPVEGAAMRPVGRLRPFLSRWI